MAPGWASDRRGAAVTVLRVTTGVVFVVFSRGKFTDHQRYLALFADYGLPSSSVLVNLTGVAELLGGLLLVLGAGTRVAALVLAATMLGAVLTAGLTEGGPLHLGLAPALLVVTLLLVRSGPGPFALDHRLGAALARRARRRRRRTLLLR